MKYKTTNLYRRTKLMQYYNINTVIDVGANTGQYIKTLVSLGFKGKIHAFEPTTSAYKKLKQVANAHLNIGTYNFALGSENKDMHINISSNSMSSSILNMLPRHLESAPESKYTDQEKIQVKTLDSVFNNMCDKKDIVLLKIDTQGFEKNVLDGGKESLSKIKLIQLELSVVPLYEKEMIYLEMISWLASLGFKLVSIEPGLSDQKTGHMLQMDGIFVKE